MKCLEGAIHEFMTKSGFDPSQPRVPAGNPDGGEWTAGGSAGATLNYIVAQNRGKPSRFERVATLASNGRDIPITVQGPPKVTKLSKEYVTVSSEDWEDYNGILDLTPNLGSNEKDVYANFFAFEGGYQADGNSFAGITPQALQDAREMPELSASLEKIRAPKDLRLNKELLPLIYQSHLDTALAGVGGVSSLEKIGNSHAALALGDALLRMGATAGGVAVGNAIMATDKDLKPGALGKPGTLGPLTLEAYSRLSAEPATLRVLMENLQRERDKKYPDEQPRNSYFSF